MHGHPIHHNHESRDISSRLPAGLLVLGWLALLGVGVALLTAFPVFAQSPQLLEMRERIEKNGWSWEADDTFINSLSGEERANLHGFVPPPDWEKIHAQNLKIFPVNKDELPSVWDWRAMDGVTPVKNQGECGSCWAFSAMAELESFVKIYYNVELDLSEQQVISCNIYGAGCGGGWAGAAYSLFLSNGAIHQHCMPYLAMDPPQAPCLQDGQPAYGWVTGWHGVANDVDQIKTALLTGPVSTGIDASPDFEMYGGGCYDTPGGAWTNHLVEIVGWDDRLCDGEGAWIIKNSWGPGFGVFGYIYVKYGAGLVGTGVTQLEYAPPPVTVQVTGPSSAEGLISDSTAEITWNTSGTPVSSVDIWFSRDGYCFETLIAADVSNTGSYLWHVPNEATTNGYLLIHPHDGTDVGYGFNREPLTIIGHKVRYVSAAGSNMPPYESPATAAHSIGDAVLACTGLDSVMIAAGDYLETVTISSTVQLFGGWNADFTLHNPGIYETRWRGLSSALRFFSTAGDFGRVGGITFHDCVGGYYSQPKDGRHGGAIYSLGASPTIHDCVFLDCRAAPGSDFGLGGAIMASGGSPMISDCQFASNVATHGGAVALLDVVGSTLSGNQFVGNSCSDSLNGNWGAGLYLEGAELSSANDVFQNNGSAAEGGAIGMRQTAFTASDLTLTGNRVQINGAAVRADSSQIDLRNAKVKDNRSSANGGGLYTNFGVVSLWNVMLTGNQATNMGGGAMIMSPTDGCVENSLVENNMAGLMGGGLFVSGISSYDVRNNLVTANTGGGLVCLGDGMTADYNDVWDNNGDDYGAGVPGLHDLAVDPLWLDPESGDYGLALHSPCLDRGDPDPACADPDGSRGDIGPLGGPYAQSVAPAAVAGATLTDEGNGSFTLSWTPNQEPDVAQYVVYRDTSEVFTPSPDRVLATLDHPDATWTDTPSYACYYLVVALDTDGHVGGYSLRLTTSPVTAVGDEDLPTALAISRVVPNPFNPRTTIWYDVPRPESVSLRVYDLRGRLVRELVAGVVAHGRHSVAWDGKDLHARTVAAGVYVVRLVAGDRVATTKVMLAK